MNRTNIEWTNRTCNPLGQGCDHNCWYCYAKRGARRNYFMHLALYNKGKRKDLPCELCRDFKPHFHPERLNDPDFERLPAGTKIFVCSVSDLFAPWTKPEWRDRVLEKIFDEKYGCLTFQLLTKNPENVAPILSDWDYRADNIWIGATITTQDDAKGMAYLKDWNCAVRFVSFEPLLSSIDPSPYVREIEWIIIGKLTGSKKIPLDRKWVIPLIDHARVNHIPLFIKDNVGWPGTRVQEFPQEATSHVR